MKFLIDRFNHETNTFSPFATPLESFQPLYGEDALNDQRNARTAMGAFIRLAEAQPDHQLITPLSATANPSGTVAAEAYTELSQRILDALSEQPDAILLDLHGALVAENAADGEGELLKNTAGVSIYFPRGFLEPSYSRCHFAQSGAWTSFIANYLNS